MPIDATKTSLQVHGRNGFKTLVSKMKAARTPVPLYHGSVAASAATFVGHFPWFFVYNKLDQKLPKWDSSVWTKLGRRALMGFTASVVSDTISNSIRVIKTVKQTSPLPITYPASVKAVYAQGGLMALFGRGLKIRIIANGTQGLLFSVLWKGIMDVMDKREKSSSRKT